MPIDVAMDNTQTCRAILEGHANKMLWHARDPRADFATICRQLRYTAELIERELERQPVVGNWAGPLNVLGNIG